MFGRHHFRRPRGPWRREEERSERNAHGGRDREDFGHLRHPWREAAERRWAGRGPGHFGRHFRGGEPFGDDPSDEDGGGHGRRRRGDIKYVLLELLAEQPRHGYDLIKELERRHSGFSRPSPGSVYPTLQMLEDEGHLTSEVVDGKRVYTITESGRRLLEERRQRHEAEGFGPPWARFVRGSAGPELDALRRSGMALLDSAMQVARHGTPEQIRAATALLDTTRREIYGILAQSGDEPPA